MVEIRKRYVARVKDSEEGSGVPLWGTLEEVERKSLNEFNIEVGHGSNILLYTRDHNDYIQCVAEYDSTCGKWGDPVNSPDLGKDYNLLEVLTDDEYLYNRRHEIIDYRIQILNGKNVVYHVYLSLIPTEVLRLGRMINKLLQTGQVLTVYGKQEYVLFAMNGYIFIEGELRSLIASSLDAEFDYDYHLGAYFEDDIKNETLRRGE